MFALAAVDVVGENIRAACTLDIFKRASNLPELTEKTLRLALVKHDDVRGKHAVESCKSTKSSRHTAAAR